VSDILSIPINWFRALLRFGHGVMPKGNLFWLDKFNTKQIPLTRQGHEIKKIMAGPLSCYDNGPAINTNFFFTDISDEGEYNCLAEPLILKIT
jgi:hypothetical protein